MDATQTLAEWAQQMANTVRHRARAKEQRHQAALLNQTQAENAWVKGMDQVVQTLEVLVQARKRTGHFPHLTLVSYARSPQGTTTYMRRGTLLSLRGLEQKSPSIDFEIDSTPPFRSDLLAPAVRAITTPTTLQPTGLRQAHCCLGGVPAGDRGLATTEPCTGDAPGGEHRGDAQEFPGVPAAHRVIGVLRYMRYRSTLSQEAARG